MTEDEKRKKFELEIRKIGNTNKIKNKSKNINTMKSVLKKSITFLVFGILISLNTKANETPSISISNANKTIKEHIKFPSLLMDLNKEEKVNVVFTVNEDGNVNLVVVNTSNEILKKSIEIQFIKLKLNNLKADNAYSVVFNFKTI